MAFANNGRLQQGAYPNLPTKFLVEEGRAVKCKSGKRGQVSGELIKS